MLVLAMCILSSGFCQPTLHCIFGTQLFPILPVNFLIYDEVVLYRHGGMTNSFLAETINSLYMGHSKHNQLLILVNMQLVTMHCSTGFRFRAP